MPNTYLSDSLLEKRKFLDKYEDTKKFMKPNTPCYAIAADWWANFECLYNLALTEYDMPMASPGPINNLSLVDLDSVYQELVHGNPNSVTWQTLRSMNDWDNMSLKKDLRYKEDFIIVSQSLWRFLEDQFGGGPEIEFILESKPQNPQNMPANVLQYPDETYLDANAIVNLDMIKVYIVKGHNSNIELPRYISPTITVNNLLSRLSNPTVFNTTLYLKTKPDGLVELESNLETLLEKGVQNGSVLVYQEDFGSGKKEQKRAGVEEIESSKDRMKEEDNYENYVDYNNNDVKEDIEMAELKNASRHNSYENNGNHNESKAKHSAELEVYLQKSREAAERPKIKLGFKTLDEIKANLVQIQEEWNSFTSASSDKNS